MCPGCARKRAGGGRLSAGERALRGVTLASAARFVQRSSLTRAGCRVFFSAVFWRGDFPTAASSHRPIRGLAVDRLRGRHSGGPRETCRISTSSAPARRADGDALSGLRHACALPAVALQEIAGAIARSARAIDPSGQRARRSAGGVGPASSNSASRTCWQRGGLGASERHGRISAVGTAHVSTQRMATGEQASRVTGRRDRTRLPLSVTCPRGVQRRPHLAHLMRKRRQTDHRELRHDAIRETSAGHDAVHPPVRPLPGRAVDNVGSASSIRWCIRGC